MIPPTTSPSAALSAVLLSTLTEDELAAADHHYPKWATMCQLRRLGLPTLDAVLITPRQGHLALGEAIITLANATGQDRLMVRSDGGAETHRYYRGGNTFPLNDAAAKATGLLMAGRAVAAQSLGSCPFHADHLGVDLASFSGHKLYGPKGVGALYVRRGTVRPIPQITGGGQEYGLRAGTLNVPGIVGIGYAAAILAEQRDIDARHITGLRDQFLAMLRRTIPDIRVNGSLTQRLPGNLNVMIPGVEADQLIENLPGLAISTGSACNTGQPDPSHVLTAIGLDRSSARSSIRIGLGRGTSLHDIITAAQQISEAVRSGAATSTTNSHARSEVRVSPAQAD